MISRIKSFLHAIVPRPIFGMYHYAWSFFSALILGFPAKDLTVILVTGTKGKTTVTELLHTILRKAGHPSALVNTIHFCTPQEEQPNKLKMTMPGRGSIHRFLARARAEGAQYAVIEASSEGAKEFRHTFLSPNMLIFTNLQKEHIESHGSFEKYKDAKLSIARSISRSSKKDRVILAHKDDPYTSEFFALPIPTKETFSLSDVETIQMQEYSTTFRYANVSFSIPLPGKFSVLNALAAIKAAEYFGVSPSQAAQALTAVRQVRGRTEYIREGQNFDVIVDYAHTPDSLSALYEAFSDRRKICVLGNTGGGRDTWKRPEMARIAAAHCDAVVLTNEDPYDEDPEKIVREMAGAMDNSPTIILDRRAAIAHAFAQAREHDVVLLTGKGTDPFIMGPEGTKEPWDDATVAREELGRINKNTL